MSNTTPPPNGSNGDGRDADGGVGFDRTIKLELHGSTVSSDGGLLAMAEAVLTTCARGRDRTGRVTRFFKGFKREVWALRKGAGGQKRADS
mgnify:CR=1 FL=1